MRIHYIVINDVKFEKRHCIAIVTSNKNNNYSDVRYVKVNYDVKYDMPI